MTTYNKILEPVYGCEELSTSELPIGMFNGNILYRKVISFGALPKATIKSVAHNISGNKVFTKIHGYTRSSGNTVEVPIPYMIAHDGVGTTLYVTQTNAVIITYSDRTFYNQTYITLEYYKV